MVNNSTFAYDDLGHCNWYFFAMHGVIVGLICTLGFIGNVLSFITFTLMRRHNSSVFLFRTLAIADSLLLIGVFIHYVPDTIIEYVGYSSPLYDKVNTFIILCFPVVLTVQLNVIWMAVLLAINRYIAVCKPLVASRLCSVSNTRKQLCSVLGFSLLVMAPRFYEEYILVTSLEYPKWCSTLNWAIYMLFFFVIPFGTILILGIMVIFTIRSSAENPIRRHGQQNVSYSVTRLVAVILLVFLICETPAVLAQVIYRTVLVDAVICGTFGFYFYAVSNVLCILNSGINFPIYIMLNKTFRHTLCTKCSVEQNNSLFQTNTETISKG